PDVLAARSRLGRAIERFTFFERFPTFLHRRQVPLAAARTDDPQAAAVDVVRESLPRAHVLHDGVAAEWVATDVASRIHDSRNLSTWELTHVEAGRHTNACPATPRRHREIDRYVEIPRVVRDTDRKCELKTSTGHRRPECRLPSVPLTEPEEPART